MDNSFTVGRFVLAPPYSDDPGSIAIYTDGGEGGDFPIEALEAVIAAFYAEHF